MFWWVTVPKATFGSHIDAGAAEQPAGVEVEILLGVRAHLPGLREQERHVGNGSQQRMLPEAAAAPRACDLVGVVAGPCPRRTAGASVSSGDHRGAARSCIRVVVC